MGVVFCFGCRACAAFTSLSCLLIWDRCPKSASMIKPISLITLLGRGSGFFLDVSPYLSFYLPIWYQCPKLARMIKRILEKRLTKLAKHFPATVILGPKQVGKTTLVKQVSSSLNKELLYLDLENPDDLKVLQSNPQVYFEQNKEKCVIIDKVQRMPSLFPRLRPVIDSYRKTGRFILLGSASPTLLKESSE